MYRHMCWSITINHTENTQIVRDNQWTNKGTINEQQKQSKGSKGSKARQGGKCLDYTEEWLLVFSW